MNTEERITALKNISAVVPPTVFDRFLIILTHIDESHNMQLVNAISNLCIKKSSVFFYTMSTGDTIETITPIREILDLLEGWILTSTVVSSANRIKWQVNFIEENEK